MLQTADVLDGAAQRVHLADLARLVGRSRAAGTAALRLQSVGLGGGQFGGGVGAERRRNVLAKDSESLIHLRDTKYANQFQNITSTIDFYDLIDFYS